MQMNFKKGGNFILLHLLAASNSSRSTCVHAKLFNEAEFEIYLKYMREIEKKKIIIFCFNFHRKKFF